ncbi:hypothetical protein EJP67_28865 [Variovorax guangxiensis]|uniref:GIY-YIG domain-containing protein n=1 Tax=Variovorax guangxiensis TaxID=1775474 RepID=A0A433MT80_9BURK|nr:GIY-YIG nuclease family protein [Variovorax guangxiensis]RUR71073.1 hypothetical protein EJP67_28865 [Variovorax guangxiensis]
MRLTEELLDKGIGCTGGHSREQLAILGVDWPLVSGWKKALLSREVSEEDFAEFVRLAKRDSEGDAHGPAPNDQDKERRVAKSAVLYIYVLALAGGHFYVGMTDNFARRFRQHCSGIAAEWTTLHPPLQALRCVPTGTSNRSQAAKMEDEVTLALMLQHGADKVRGGQYANVSQEFVDFALKSHGHWDKFKRRELDRQAFESEGSWAEALDSFLKVALTYYDAGAPVDQCDAVFAACYRLTRYRYWREEFAPALSWDFWSRKGVLPVLLTFKYGRVIGSRSASPHDVLASALNRGRRNKPKLQRLFLLAWKGYLPPVTPSQAVTTERFMQYLTQQITFDHQYDEFVSVLLPELRHLLRSRAP